MTDQNEHRKKFSILIDPHFQGRIIAFIFLAGFLCVTVTALVYYWYVVDSYDFIFKSSGLPQMIIDERYSDLYGIWVWLSLINGLIILVVAAWVLFLTHRAAGSIYHMKRVIEEFKSGKADARVHLRQKDEFQDLARSLNELLDATQKK